MSLRQMTDKEALDVMAQWFQDMDPVLNGSHDDWVWDMVSVFEDVLVDTGRKTGDDEE